MIGSLIKPMDILIRHFSIFSTNFPYPIRDVREIRIRREKKRTCILHASHVPVTSMYICSISIREMSTSTSIVKDALRGSERLIRELACARTSPLVS